MDRTQRELTDADLPSFCKNAGLDEARKRGHALTPGPMSEWTPKEEGGEPFEDRMNRLVAQLGDHRAEGEWLAARDRKSPHGAWL